MPYTVLTCVNSRFCFCFCFCLHFTCVCYLTYSCFFSSLLFKFLTFCADTFVSLCHSLTRHSQQCSTVGRKTSNDNREKSTHTRSVKMHRKVVVIGNRMQINLLLNVVCMLKFTCIYVLYFTIQGRPK